MFEARRRTEQMRGAGAWGEKVGCLCKTSKLVWFRGKVSGDGGGRGGL